MELVESGWIRLAPPADAESLAKAINSAMGRPRGSVAPYGTGSAAKAFVDTLSFL